MYFICTNYHRVVLLEYFSFNSPSLFPRYEETNLFILFFLTYLLSAVEFNKELHLV